MLSLGKRIATAAVVAAAAVGLMTAGATPAAAGTVTSRWTCVNPFGGITGPFEFRITVNAPATAQVGQTATLTASFHNVANSGIHVPAGVWTGRLEIALGGAASGLIYAHGLVNPATPPDRPLVLDGGQLQYTFTSPGAVTFQPRQILLFYNGNGTQICANTATPVAATTQVS